MDYELIVREIISKSISVTVPIEQIAIEDELQSVGMDSISFIQIIIEIEKEFDIEFPDEKLLITEAGTINKLCDIVEALTNEEI